MSEQDSRFGGSFAEILRTAATTDTALTTVFDEEPVSLTIFVQDRQYLGNPPLSEVQYDAVRHIERVYYQETYAQLAAVFDRGKKDRFFVGPSTAWREEPYWSLPCRMTNFATLQWGKGSGKDHVARLASMRIAYLLMCLRSPQAYYAMPEQDTIHLLNVASSSAQAQQAFFMPIVRAVRRKGNWFLNRCEPRQNTISFYKNVESISGHSDAESQEGLNLMLGIADEIDAFKTKAETANRRGSTAREPTKSAENILGMMRTSGATRFPAVYKNVRISFPRYKGSTIQRLTTEGLADIKTNGIDSRHYVSGPLATWDVNPRVPGKEVFKQDYVDDPVMARSKYECKPARAINPYFRNRDALDDAFKPRRQPPIDVRYSLEGDGPRKVWVPLYTFADDFYAVRGARYAMHADLAVTADRAGIAMAHVARWEESSTVSEDEDGAAHTLREVRPHVVVDFVIPFTADIGANPPREIQIRWARQLCFELLRRGFPIVTFTFDGYQSTDSMQILETKGIETDRLSTDVSEDPWRTLRDVLYEGRLTIPAPEGFNTEPEPTPFLLRDELYGLARAPNGKIDHPNDGGSKDLADALACAVVGAIALGGEEEAARPRSYFSEPDIEVGRGVPMPFGMRVKDVWQTSMPDLPIGF